MNALAGLVVAATLSPAAATAVAGTCDTDRMFVQAGWIVHGAEEFGAALQAALRRIDDEEGLGYTSATPVHNEELGKFLVRMAFDQVETAGETMIDDLVLYVDDETRAIYEVRWFDGAQKHVVYANLSCANRSVPLAYNSMW